MKASKMNKRGEKWVLKYEMLKYLYIPPVRLREVELWDVMLTLLGSKARYGKVGTG